MHAFLMRMKPTRSEAIDAVAAGVLVAIALLGFKSSYGGIEFMIIGLVAVLFGLILAHVLVRAKLPVVVAVATVALGYLLIGGVVALSDRAIAGFIPSVDTIVGAARTAVFGWKELITTNPPVGGTGTLMMLPFLCGYGAALLGSLLMRNKRLYAAAIVPALVVLGVGIVTGVQRPVAPLVQGGFLAVVAIAWMSIRQDRSRPRLPGHKFNANRFATAVTLLALCTAAGWYVAPSLPRAEATDRTVWRQTVIPPFDPRQYPSPLSAYRYYVKDAVAKKEVMFTIEGLPKGAKIRLSTMDSYDGLVWRPSYRADTPSTLNSGYFERMGSEIPSDYGGETATITVTIAAYEDFWVPDVGEVLSLRFEGGPRDDKLNEALRYNRATDTAASRVKLIKGDRYVMTVRIPATLANLAKAEILPDVPVGAVYNISPALDKWAATPGILSIKDIGSRIDALRDKMIADGAYSDGDKAQGQADSLAGHSEYRLNSFILTEPMRGDAEQYASALALMLRNLDRVPTRVVMGFEPDASQFSAGANSVVEITGQQVEAWVEVPVKGLGWVAVVPTPERSETALKAKAPAPPVPDYETQVPPPPAVLDPDFDSPATSKTGAKDTRKPEPDKPLDAKDPSKNADDVSSSASGISMIAVGAIGSPLAIVVVLSSGILLLKFRRRRRRRRRGVGHVRIANGWREVTDVALDLGRPIPQKSTRREAAQFVGQSTTMLAARADQAVFSAAEPTNDEVAQYWAELETALKSMRRQAGPINRIKAALSMTSLRQGRRDRATRVSRRDRRAGT